LRLRSTTAVIALALALAAVTAHAQMARSPAPEDAELYFISPQDGDVVSGTFTVRFGLRGMGVAPAGIDQHNTGHHHLIINVPEEDIPMQQPLPTSEQFVHFGGGQTEAEVTLPPGVHTLQLVLGNYLHIPHDPPVMSKAISVTVEECP
jgi:hypothetical protein